MDRSIHVDGASGLIKNDPALLISLFPLGKIRGIMTPKYDEGGMV